MNVFSVVGGCAGKTETVRRLVAELTARSLRVSTIKRVSDAVDLERQGSGSWKHRAAGAEEVMLASAGRLALMREMPNGTDEPDVDRLLARMARLTSCYWMDFGAVAIRRWRSSSPDRIGRCSHRMIPSCWPLHPKCRSTHPCPDCRHPISAQQATS